MRSFFAIPLPGAVRRRLGETQTALAAGIIDIRWVRAESLHLTLIFLGEIEEAQAEALAAAAGAACARSAAGVARIGGLGFFTSRGSPRVLWARVREEGEGVLNALHRALGAAAAEHGIQVEERPYAPHITLGRAKSRLSLAAVRRSVGALGEVELGEMRLERCILYRSILGPGGARYEVRASAALGADG